MRALVESGPRISKSGCGSCVSPLQTAVWQLPDNVGLQGFASLPLPFAYSSHYEQVPVVIPGVYRRGVCAAYLSEPFPATCVTITVLQTLSAEGAVLTPHQLVHDCKETLVAPQPLNPEQHGSFQKFGAPFG